MQVRVDFRDNATIYTLVFSSGIILELTENQRKKISRSS